MSINSQKALPSLQTCAMREKLYKFRRFAEQLLPIETELLCRIEQFEDPQRKFILDAVHHWANNSGYKLNLDENIDKRKYSDMLKWMQKRLNDLDVDYEYEELRDVDIKIHRDHVEIDDERTILKHLDRLKPNSYNFIAFYEVLQKYRHFLLIRMHFEPFGRVDKYLTEHENAYQTARAISDKLQIATKDIVAQYTTGTDCAEDWDAFLLETFNNERLDGQNRYAALVRYTFSVFNRRAYHQLKVPYQKQELLFQNGDMYSRRLLLNYYSNRSILHAHLEEHEAALMYGYLSVKSPNNDYIHYVNNLAALLLRQNKAEESLLLIRKAFPYVKNISTFQHRLGLVTFYLLSLNRTGQHQESDRFATSFFKGYKKETFNHRWYLFMSAWLQALIQLKKFDKINLLLTRNELLKLEKKFSERSAYMPYIPVYGIIAAYRTGGIRRDTARKKLVQLITDIRYPGHKKRYINELLHEIQQFLPEVGSINPPYQEQ